MFTTGNTTVDTVGKMHFEGNTIPHLWYENIRFENDKPDLNAIIILAEIVYWYRPTYVRDELTGQTLEVKKRFNADLLQRSYESFSDQFGISKRQAKDAIVRLENMGLIKRHFRTINPHGTPLSNVLFIELSVSHLGGVTFKRQRVSHPNITGSDISTSEVSHSNVTPMTSQRQTYTEITTEITTDINNNDDDKTVPSHVPGKKELNAFEFYEQNHFGALGSLIANKIDGWINDLSEPLVIKAMEKAVMNGKTNWGYVETILKDWSNKKLLTLEAVEAEDLRWKNQQIKTQQQTRPQRAYQQSGRKEVVPDWFHKRNENQQQEPTEQQNTNIDFEAERQKILASLGKIDATVQERL